ncbi:MAG: tripartite tricarboxylate transporter substrate binding protein [Saprospiraceae bacterium]|nr:tripartite tricarboxylate transporter substrate binding protein [Saprospiraceae bacterium]
MRERSIKKLLGIMALFISITLSNGCGEGGGSSDANYPARPVTMMVPWAAGGMTDLSSRALAAVLQKHLGVSVNVVNRTGGGGVIGHLALSQARPDGYTIGAVTVEITMMHNMGLTELIWEDFTPLSLMVDNAAGITVRMDSPYETVQDLIDAVKADPGNLQASGTSRGGIWDLARIGFLRAVGLKDSDMPWVPSQGASPALQELLASGVDVVTASLTEVDALRRAGQVKTLAVMADERLENFPDVPTLKEQGIDWSLGGWVSVCAPKGLPDVVKAKLEEAILKTMEDPEFRDAMNQAGSNIREIQGDLLVKFLEGEHTKNEESMTLAGLKQ